MPPPILPPRSYPATPAFDDDMPGLLISSPVKAEAMQLTTARPPNHPYSDSIGIDDPRSSSYQSLRPERAPIGDQRKLLVIYIHGFMGDETSFQSFPAHVHSVLTLSMAESHVVHTKIYPRYQSRNSISLARDAFSNWLVPHESDQTDIVLVGHSLGGILGADVVLLPSHVHGSNEALQHRIIGLIALDTPFLGMHPGVVKTGIVSLFRGAPEPAQTPNDAVSTDPASQLFGTVVNDPNFNSPFPNDVNKPVRSGRLGRAWYFFNKHKDDLTKAASTYVKSHLEFGSCMADYTELNQRYTNVRALENVDEVQGQLSPQGLPLRRVRFVNYYTASTGRIKEAKPEASEAQLILETEMQTMERESNHSLTATQSHSASSFVSADEYREGGDESYVDKDVKEREPELASLDPRPEEEMEGAGDGVIEEKPLPHRPDELPEIPTEPKPPVPLDAMSVSSSESSKTAKKEYEERVKAYREAKKKREEAIKTREKLIKKQARDAAKQKQELAKAERQEQIRRQREEEKRQVTLNPEEENKALGVADREAKKRKDRKFCTLPARDPKTGARDNTWVRVYVDGVDEVVAHTTLFNMSDTYAKLVGDVAQRIAGWVNDAATTRLILQEKALGGV